MNKLEKIDLTAVKDLDVLEHLDIITKMGSIYEGNDFSYEVCEEVDGKIDVIYNNSICVTYKYIDNETIDNYVKYVDHLDISGCYIKDINIVGKNIRTFEASNTFFDGTAHFESKNLGNNIRLVKRKLLNVDKCQKLVFKICEELDGKVEVMLSDKTYIAFDCISNEEISKLADDGGYVNLSHCYIKNLNLANKAVKHFDAKMAFLDGDINFSNTNFDDVDVDFSRTVFNGNVDFSGAKFSEGYVGFANAVFNKGDINFTNVEFSDGVKNFGLVDFGNGKVDFSNTNFQSGYVVFSNAKFGTGTKCFGNAKVNEGVIYFDLTNFGNGDIHFNFMDFGKARVSFFGANFGNNFVDFSNVNFGNVANNDKNNDENNDKNQNSQQSKVVKKTVKAESKYNYQKFGDIDYRDNIATKFGEVYVVFAKAKFGVNKVSFTNVDFGRGDVNFSKTDFSEAHVDFTNAVYNMKADRIINLKHTKFIDDNIVFGGSDLKKAWDKGLK